MALINKQFDGIIMYRRDYRERDLLVKILTAEYGKRMFMVKNAKKKGAIIAPDILPFTAGSYVGALDFDGLSFLNAARETEHFYKVSEDISKNAYITYILALIDSAFGDNVSIGNWYQNALTAMKQVDDGADEQIISNIIEVQLLPAFGVAPHWDDCVICNRTDLPMDYSSQYGGLLCQNHYHLDQHRYHLDQRTVYYLRQFSVLKLDRVATINVRDETKTKLRAVLDQLYEENVGLHLKSKHFIDQMSSWADKLKQSRSKDN